MIFSYVKNSGSRVTATIVATPHKKLRVKFAHSNNTQHIESVSQFTLRFTYIDSVSFKFVLNVDSKMFALYLIALNYTIKINAAMQ